MANPDHVAILRTGVDAWNEWRRENPSIAPDLSKADLQGRNLSYVHFGWADLSHAKLTGGLLTHAGLIKATLKGADLHRADLREAYMEHAELTGADLSGTNCDQTKCGNARFVYANISGASFVMASLRGCELSYSRLTRANFTGADLTGAILSQTEIGLTIFGSCKLASAAGLMSCSHRAPSVLDFWTLKLSPDLPLAFVRACGVPERVIEYLRSLVQQAVEFYSCFISYSTKDQEFASRLYSDLQKEGVLCWLATEDLKIGDKFRTLIEESIRLHDKLLLVLSETSIVSPWVEDEVESALERERRENRLVLFPIRIDDAVMNTNIAWAAHLRQKRQIGNFCAWKEHHEYERRFQRLLRDLKADPAM